MGALGLGADLAGLLLCLSAVLLGSVTCVSRVSTCVTQKCFSMLAGTTAWSQLRTVSHGLWPSAPLTPSSGGLGSCRGRSVYGEHTCARWQLTSKTELDLIALRCGSAGAGRPTILLCCARRVTLEGLLRITSGSRRWLGLCPADRAHWPLPMATGTALLCGVGLARRGSGGRAPFWGS